MKKWKSGWFSWKEKKRRRRTGECFLAGTRMQWGVHLPSCPAQELQCCKTILQANAAKLHLNAILQRHITMLHRNGQ